MRERYDYRQSLKEDIISYIEENHISWNDDNREEIEEQLRDDLWLVDSVTGNGSGSYTFNAWEAEENLCHNLELLGEALEEFGCSPDYLIKHGAEECDVTIRCYLLGECISIALDEIEEGKK